ncbi:hypothetical protein BUALT_Bualt14G0002000 [Buddleja alternifolia]|uniref:NPF family transporter n=1 Tax=Buddleja alternifolia TaxID=168488 RepID=A0AAV6WGM5_9LAMI|nr:hypothetical protein BUALT_Bualt14G0002000 [Buddleja alternifolia]
MAATGDEISIAADHIPLLKDDAMTGSLDFKGRPSLRSKSGCWKSASFIIVIIYINCYIYISIGIGVAERLAYYGISLNLLSYLTGQLGQPTATAVSLLNAWYGTASLLPIVGAFVADSFSGRFRMIIMSSLVYITGLGFMTLSASLNSFNSCKSASHNTTSCSPPHLHIIFFFCSLYLVALAQGGYAPCVQAFGADQFDEEHKIEFEAKSSFFNWWYCFSVGGMVPLLFITYIQENVSWELGFGIPAIIMCFALILFLSGTTTYRFRINDDGRNPFIRINRVFVESIRNWRAKPISLEEEGHQIMPHTQDTQFKFLDKALLAQNGSMGDENICSASDVEDAKAILKLGPIWFAALGYAIIYAQPSTLFTKQAATIDRHITPTFQIPAASLQQCFITVSIMVCVPMYDRIFVPVARAITKKPSGISIFQRIGIGLFVSLTSMVFAALVERKRLAIAMEYGLVDMPKAIVPMSVWWIAPQYVLSGIADVFAMVGLQEFFYDQVPFDLKSIGLALYCSIIGIGNLLSSLLVTTIQKATSGNGEDGWFSDNLNRGHLDYFYWVLAGISVCGFAAFICFTTTSSYGRRISR